MQGNCYQICATLICVSFSDWSHSLDRDAARVTSENRASSPASTRLIATATDFAFLTVASAHAMPTLLVSIQCPLHDLCDGVPKQFEVQKVQTALVPNIKYIVCVCVCINLTSHEQARPVTSAKARNSDPHVRQIVTGD